MGKSALISKQTAISAVFFVILSSASHAAPILVTPSVQPNGANVSANGSVTNINQTQDKVIINWNSFDINVGERVVFNQPNTSSIALNRVHNGLPTSIMGELSANGRVFVVNPSGMLIGAGARVETGSFLGTSASISDGDFMAGNYNFTNTGINSSIANNGNIISKDGFVVLAGNSVSNTGTITAGVGRTFLASGGSFTLDLSGADAMISITSDISGASTVNSGTIDGSKVYIISNADRADLLKGAVNNSGVVNADTIHINSDDGTIVLSGELNAKAEMNSVIIDGGSIASTALINAKDVDAKSMTILDMTNLQTIGKLNASAPQAIKLESTADLNIDKITSARVSLSSGGNLNAKEISAGNISLSAAGSVNAGIAFAADITANSSDVTLKLLVDGNITYSQNNGKLNLESSLPTITSKLIFNNKTGEIHTDFNLVKNTDISLDAEKIFLTKIGSGGAIFDLATYAKFNPASLKLLDISSESGISFDAILARSDMQLYLSALNGDILLNSALELSSLNAKAFNGNIIASSALNVIKTPTLDVLALGDIKLYTDIDSASLTSESGNIFLKEKNDINITTLSAIRGNADISMTENGVLSTAEMTAKNITITTEAEGSTINVAGKLGFEDITIKTTGINNIVKLSNERDIFLNSGSVLTGVQDFTVVSGGGFTFSTPLHATNLLSITAKSLAKPTRTDDLFSLTADKIFLNIERGGSFVLDTHSAEKITADLNSSNGALNIFLKKDLVLKNLEPIIKKQPILAANAYVLNIGTYKGDGGVQGTVDVSIENQMNVGQLTIRDVGNVMFSGYAAGIQGLSVDIAAAKGIEGVGIIKANSVKLTAENIGAAEGSALYVNAASALFSTVYSPNGNLINIHAPSYVNALKNYKFISSGPAFVNGKLVDVSVFDKVHEYYGEFLYPIEETNIERIRESDLAKKRNLQTHDFVTVEFPIQQHLEIFDGNGKQELRAQ